jgi:hypothetical protein
MMPIRVTTTTQPDLAQRFAASQRPHARVVMRQQWRDLLFLHWSYPVEAIRRTLPPGLHVDTFEGRAWLGVVPFFMRHVRPSWSPSVPGISNFMELNLRTYVHDAQGVPGVWFYSLDANQPVAVAVARRFFHLPYVHARMHATRTESGTIRYHSQRSGAQPDQGCEFEYGAGSDLPACAPESFEFFLVERYHLYAHDGLRLLRGTVHHQPYPLCEAQVTKWNGALLQLNGFEPPGGAPDHAVMSRGVNVEIFGLREVLL